MSAEARLLAAWYAPGPGPLALALAPLVPLYAFATAVRRWSYRAGLARSRRLPVPVVVVGNITVGGSGKTPVVAALGQALAVRGWRPGVVSRGYGRDPSPAGRPEPMIVRSDDDPARVGDEPLLLARTGLPVAVARDRAAAGRALLTAHPDVDVILADDGLQHYRLHRDVEIAVVDGRRGLGNGWLLPAGPLREGPARLADADAVVVLDAPAHAGVPAAATRGEGRRAHGAETGVAGEPEVASFAWPGAFRAELEVAELRRVDAPDVTRPPSDFGSGSIHAVAGIGNPQRFFATLASLGIRAREHAFPDHHRFSAGDLDFPDASAILMTEKDAVKCAPFADARCWFLPVRARLDPAFVARVEEMIRGSQTA